uniref:Uncharacterized protein n=1 Tax=Romanomermis culicivorax TaxID=13658 RepID=A0A915KAY6_ROMCU
MTGDTDPLFFIKLIKFVRNFLTKKVYDTNIPHPSVKYNGAKKMPVSEPRYGKLTESNADTFTTTLVIRRQNVLKINALKT